MTIYKWLCVLMFLWLFLIAIVPNASGQEDFYWKNSYGRGVGKIPVSHVCLSGKEEDAGLCYEPCRAGYHRVGPVCWQNKASYGRGAGTIPSIHGCKNGKEKQAGLCYTPCKPGYHGVGPVCWENGPKSYGRGVGTPLVSVCATGMEADAGLCYPKCKTDFHGIGPVCWGNTPSGYVACGAGFAKDSKTCAKITAEQVAAVGIFVGTTVVPAAKAARNAEKAAEEGAKGKETFEALRPLLDKFKTTFKNVKTSKPGTMMTNIKKNWDDLSYADQTKIKVALKLVTAGPSTVNDATKDQINPIDLLRDAANIASAFDPSGVLSVAAAYIYPVYGVKY